MVIPADWKEVRLGEFSELSLAASKKSRGDGRGKYIIADMGSVSKDGSFLTHKTTDIRADVLRTGDLVMPKDDIGGGQIIGKAVLVVEDERYVLGDHVYRLRLTDGFPAFVRYAINSFKVNTQLRSKVVGSAQLGLGRRSVLEQPISMPPLKEQEAIAEALSDADAAIESLDALITKKRDVKQATMQQLLTGRTRLPGFNADWKEVRLGECASFFKGNGLSKSQLIDDGPQKCVHYGELFSNYGPVIQTVANACIPFDGSFKSQQGDVLMPGSDVTPRGLATASSIQVSDVILGGDVIVIRPERSSLHGPFLSNLIRVSKSSILRLVKGSTVYHIHAKDLSDFELLKPPLKEQEAIAEALNVIDDELEALTKQVTKLRMVKEGMMQDLLTGKVRLA